MRATTRAPIRPATRSTWTESLRIGSTEAYTRIATSAVIGPPSLCMRRMAVTMVPGPARKGKPIGNTAARAGSPPHPRETGGGPEQHPPGGHDEHQDPSRHLELRDADLEDLAQHRVPEERESHHDGRCREHGGAEGAQPDLRGHPV